MDLRALRFFAAVADHSGFSRAAEQLGISQPALSRQISALERELQVKLFDRVGRHTMLTAAGENLLERGRSLLHEADAIKSHAHEIAGGSYGALRLGATPQSIESFVAKLLARFCARVPNVEISILEDGAANLVEATQRGSIHVAIASLPTGTELLGRPLFPIHTVAVVPQDHPLDCKGQLEVADLAPYRLLLLRRNFLSRQLFDSACKMAHVSPKILLESNNAQALLALAKVGQGIAILPSTVKLQNVRQKLVPVWHDHKPIEMWMSAIWDPRRYQTPAAKIFIEEAYQFTRKEFPGRQVGSLAAATARPRSHRTSRRAAARFRSSA
ncbi:MAG TPA: LysR family transcriptional regulator [Pseudolabrys sp.]|nr:LysR family transcriptional regulator [Pseudolabrys sp.]